ncbi:hypothetical protein AX14_003507, partial [Amanita brunnescens Koide BX004]
MAGVHLSICSNAQATIPIQRQSRLAQDDTHLIQKRADIVHTAAALLEKSQLIKYECLSGRFQSTGWVRRSLRHAICR